MGGIVTVLLHVSFDSLATEKDPVTGAEESRVALYAQVRAADGPALDHTYAVLELPRGARATGNFTYHLTFRLEPGEYLAEASVSDMAGGGQVSTAKELTVPAAAAAKRVRTGS